MEKIAEEIFNIIREQIISRYPFLANAAYAVDGRPILVDAMNDKLSTLYTDGDAIYYDIHSLINTYQEDETRLVHTLLHTLLHLLFLHPWKHSNGQKSTLERNKQSEDTEFDTELWNLACDIAVESVIAELSPDAYSEKEIAYLSDIKKQIPFVSAKTIYQHLKEPISEIVHANTNTNTDLSNPVISSFKKDIHIYWCRKEKEDIKQNEDDKSQKQSQDQDIQNISSHTGKQNAVVRRWLAISRKTLNEWKNLYHAKGSGSGSFMENLMYTNKKTYDYRHFLKQFAAYREITCINDEEFDYIYYTYGLKLYENLPLIEPLEYKMENRIQDFVIALDTSGSCSGALLQEFVNRTFDILKSEETFHRKMNIHLLQCDSDITNIKIINNQQDIKAAIENFNVYGYGGTDFRPVFSYVDAMIENGTFTDLKGLIYFTDGEGTFPTKIPDYKTAFVFVEDGFTEPKVPAWAIRVVLSQTEIMNI